MKRTKAASEVVEVTLVWGEEGAGNVLGVNQVERGTLALGEHGDVLVPEEVLGTDRFEIVRIDEDGATAHAPAGAQVLVDGWPSVERSVVLERGKIVRMRMGSFSLRVELTAPGDRTAAAPLVALEEGAGFFAGSAFFHAAAFAAVALFAPPLGATEEDPFDPDRLALIQHLMNASAQREEERSKDMSSADSAGDSDPGQRATGKEGEAGKPDTDKKDGKWAAKGTARPETATLPRERALAETETSLIIGLRSMALGDPGAPTAPWGTELSGANDVNRIGHLFGGSIDDATGTGGWGVLGPGQGGGGTANAIGLGNFDGLGQTGLCTGGPCNGIGKGGGVGGRGHKVGSPSVRYPMPTTNGKLPAEIIQRIVRLGDGRYRFCYEQGLRGNPGLTGRVTVKFMIDRTGAVAFSADGGSDIADQTVVQCVVRSFQTLSFPEPQGGTVTVVYPIVFNPQ
jgi:hypothetical protein